MSKKLSFLVAGVQKAGTTSFHSYISQHPLIEMSAKKETHFFDNESNAWNDPDYGRLHDYFDSTGEQRIRGEATPITIYWVPSHKRIFHYNESMKFIFLFRDPALRAYSHWRMETGRGWETLDFATAIREGRSRITKDVAPSSPPEIKYPERGEVPGLSRVYSYVERGFYGHQISEMLRYFPISNMLFILSDDFFRKPSETMDKVCDFLKLPKSPSDLEPRLLGRGRDTQPEEQMTREDWQYLRSIYQDDLKLFLELTGLTPSEWPTLG